jgi:hypothetical protein
MNVRRAPESAFAQRLARSAWVESGPRLLDAMTELNVEQGPAQRALSDEAVARAQPGPVDARRVVRHATAASVSRALRVATGLPAAVSTRRPLTDPAGWFRDAAVEAFVDQLALGGPPSAELARLIEGAGQLFPEPLRRELARREIRALDLLPAAAQAIVDLAFAPSSPDDRQGVRGPDDRQGRHDRDAQRVFLVSPTPVTGTPVSSLYPAVANDERSLVRVRRPRIAQHLVTDSRLAAGAAGVLTRLTPETAGIGPIGFVHLVLRQNLEAIDLRFEALDLVELAMVLEDGGHAGLVVARPRAGLIDERALVVEATDGEPLDVAGPGAGARVDTAAVLPALIAVTLEAAIGHGVFWADPAPEHLLVRDDGRLALVGVGTLGRFTPELRLAGVRTIKAILTGDYAGLVDGMRIAGALGPDVDTAGLLADLSGNDRLDPMKVMLGGEEALLASINALVGIMLAHRLEPPVEVTLLLRTLFATGRLVSLLDPGGSGLKGAVMGLVPRLPALIAAAEDAV